MAIIKKLSYFDKKKIKDMISFLGNHEAEKFVERLINNTCNFFHYWLPIELKFLPESYVLVEDKILHGMITVVSANGNHKKINITKLLFKKNYYDVGKQLIEFIIARFGAKGVQSFKVAVDESHDELLKLFLDGCGFRRCSLEQLWRVNNFETFEVNPKAFRKFKNSDAQAVAMLFNDSIITHFKPSLLKTQEEYKEFLFKGLSENNTFSYILEDSNLHTILAYFSIGTFDNDNYVLNLISSNGFDINYDTILNFAINEIKKRKSEYSLFVKLNKYTTKAEIFEQYLKEKNFNCVQTQLILVKDFYKIIKQDSKSIDVVIFNEKGHPVFKS